MFTLHMLFMCATMIVVPMAYFVLVASIVEAHRIGESCELNGYNAPFQFNATPDCASL